jgi:cytochrome c-type biogenesis protein
MTTRFLAVLLAVGACVPAEGTSVLVGERAPAYAATMLSGDTVSTADLEGKVVLLNVWATWCAPCREEIPYLQSLYEAHRERGLEIVGVSVDARGQEETIEGFIRDFGMTYPIWRDPDERVQSLFMALGVPASYIIDRQGVLRWRRLGTVRATDTTFTSTLEKALREGE